MTSVPGHTQALAAQVSPIAHETPHPPQLATLVVVSMHPPPHDIRGSLHSMAHAD
jgi:hypothetical protein